MWQRRFNRSRGATVASLVALVAMATLLAAILIPAITRARETANRVKCAGNMRQIGQAMLLYANDNHGVYPRTIFQGGDTVIPDVSNAGANSTNPFAIDTTVPANCIPSALFLLMRTEDIASTAFCCPSTSAKADDFGGGGNGSLDRSNFSDLRANLSYSLANPYPDNQAMASGFKMNTSIDPGFVILADKNPGVVSGSDVLSVTTDSSLAQMRRANSLNHGRDGQNVLFADGHVEFDDTPLVGINHDNIYCRGAGGPGSDKSDLVNSPKDASDSVLLPAEGN
ncbi:MAG TPA: hypothetical protein VL992_08085 [Tepidisphaeraceae bacterium]|nr:hypothetical protein [Tepidisphaeraceae bacterium]